MLRPHRTDPADGVAALARGLGTGVDATTPMTDLLAGADVCVGATWTAALESALVGTPLVMLNTTGSSWTPPLDGSGTVPFARDAHELAAELRRILEARAALGQDELLAALGHGPGDATDALAGWLAELARGRLQ